MNNYATDLGVVIVRSQENTRRQNIQIDRCCPRTRYDSVYSNHTGDCSRLENGGECSQRIGIIRITDEIADTCRCGASIGGYGPSYRKRNIYRAAADVPNHSSEIYLLSAYGRIVIVGDKRYVQCNRRRNYIHGYICDSTTIPSDSYDSIDKYTRRWIYCRIIHSGDTIFIRRIYIR